MGIKIIFIILVQEICLSLLINQSTHQLTCSQPLQTHQFFNISSPNHYINIKLTFKSDNTNAIMKVYPFQSSSPNQFRHLTQYQFQDQTTKDDSLIDFSSLFLHSSNQYVSIESTDQFYISVYLFQSSDFQYSETDTEFKGCQNITYKLRIKSQNSIEGPECINGYETEYGKCMCSESSYIMDNCEAEFMYLSEAGNYQHIESGQTHYYYYKIIGDTQQIELSINFESNSGETNMLMHIQEGNQPSTIACIFNQINPQIKSIVLKQNQLLLITVYQKSSASNTYYSIWISLTLSPSLLLILLLSLAGFFLLIIIGVCIFYFINNSTTKRKNFVANIIFSYDSIFPPITFKNFVKFIGKPDHQNCVICLQDFEQKSEVKYTVCSHILHGKCLDGWLTREENCPLCREEFSDENLSHWQTKLDLDFEEEYKKFQKRVEMEKKKKGRNNESQHETLTSIRKGKQANELDSNLTNKSDYGGGFSKTEQFALAIYSKIFTYHKKMKREPNDHLETLIFQMPSKQEQNVQIRQIKKSFRLSEKRQSDRDSQRSKERKKFIEKNDVMQLTWQMERQSNDKKSQNNE